MNILKDFSERAYQWGGRHFSFVKGIFALLFGIALIYLARGVILNLIVFSGGLMLVYYGLLALRLTKITDFIDKVAAKLRA